MEKITKKQYYELIKENVHYNLGIIYNKNKFELIDNLEMVYDKIRDKETFNSKEYLEKYCLKCTGATKNTVDFLHIQEGKKEYLHEQVKGKFWKTKETINGITYVYHYYNDLDFSVKAII